MIADREFSIADWRIRIQDVDSKKMQIRNGRVSEDNPQSQVRNPKSL